MDVAGLEPPAIDAAELRRVAARVRRAVGAYLDGFEPWRRAYAADVLRESLANEAARRYEAATGMPFQVGSGPEIFAYLDPTQQAIVLALEDE